MAINNCTFMGRFTADPELMSSRDGKHYNRFTLAVDRSFGDATDFINFASFGKTAEFISKWFHKGDLIAVTGSLNTDKYEKDGQKRTSYTVAVQNASFCGRTGATPQQDTTRSADLEPIDDDGDLPF